eukprot:619949-Heterocapsa_arctica.AAC.1
MTERAQGGFPRSGGRQLHGGDGSFEFARGRLPVLPFDQKVVEFTCMSRLGALFNEKCEERLQRFAIARCRRCLHFCRL